MIGSLSANNYIPLFACTSAPLRIELQLVDSVYKMCGNVNATASTMQITNCEFIANMIELSDDAMGMIQESLSGSPLQFVVPDYRNYQYTITLTSGSTTQINFPIPAKFSSLKSLFVTQRVNGSAANGASAYFPHSSVANGIADYYFRVGPQIMPPKAPNTLPEMFAELMKAIGGIATITHTPSIEYSAYSLNANTALNTTTDANLNSAQSGSFYIGLDLENYPDVAKDTIFAGYNSNTDDIFAIIDVTPATSGSTRYDAFAMFDCVVVFENGTSYVRF